MPSVLSLVQYRPQMLLHYEQAPQKLLQMVTLEHKVQQNAYAQDGDERQESRCAPCQNDSGSNCSLRKSRTGAKLGLAQLMPHSAVVM